MPRWCLTARRVRFLATSCSRWIVRQLFAIYSASVIPQFHCSGSKFHITPPYSEGQTQPASSKQYSPITRIQPSDKRKRRYRPQRYPSCAGDGREQSKLSGEGSCAGGKGIRTFHSGSGRSCCRHGRTAYPVSRKANLSTNILICKICIGDGFDRSCSL